MVTISQLIDNIQHNIDMMNQPPPPPSTQNFWSELSNRLHMGYMQATCWFYVAYGSILLLLLFKIVANLFRKTLQTVPTDIPCSIFIDFT
jgi:hypothetical protein